MTPKEVRQAWVEALRSDEYEQAQNTLRRDDGYCCLGVLCDLYVKHTGNAEWLDDLFLLINDDDNEYEEFLPEPVREWAGLRTEEGKYGEFSLVSLSTKNDNGADFEEIAEIIESEPEGLLA